MRGRVPARGRIYIAGPMSGIEEYNFPAFHRAERALRAAGWDVFNPARNDIELDGFDPATDVARPREWYMARDLPAVLSCSHIGVLPGWVESPGARQEVVVALMVGNPVIEVIAEETGPAVFIPQLVGKVRTRLYQSRRPGWLV